MVKLASLVELSVQLKATVAEVVRAAAVKAVGAAGSGICGVICTTAEMLAAAGVAIG